MLSATFLAGNSRHPRGNRAAVDLGQLQGMQWPGVLLKMPLGFDQTSRLQTPTLILKEAWQHSGHRLGGSGSGINFLSAWVTAQTDLGVELAGSLAGLLW